MHSTGPRSPAPHSLEGRVDIWVARTAEPGDPSFLRRCREILPPEELEACAAFQREEDRRRALRTRVLLRETLSRYAPVAAQDWSFAPGPQGKPGIVAPAAPDLRFNLSHTGTLVVCALTCASEIGVDLEDTTRELDPLELADRVCAVEELETLRALAPDARRRRFFELWTLKEAYLKARGLGFALEPRSIRFDFPEPGRVRAQMSPEAGDDPAAWWFALPRAEPGHTLALALRNGGRPARVRTFLRAHATSTA
jgi:4'-phosphopantetheinyl transferase